MKKTIRIKLQNLNPEAILFDEWADSAIIGLCRVSNFAPVALYSKKQIYAILALRNINSDDIDDYYTSKFLNIRAGEFTPVIFDDTQEQ